MKQIFIADLGEGFYQLTSSGWKFNTERPCDFNTTWINIFNSINFWIFVENYQISKVFPPYSYPDPSWRGIPAISIRDLSALRRYPTVNMASGNCTCGNISAHSKRCPEYKELTLQELADLAAQHMTSGVTELDPGEPMPIYRYYFPTSKCECGSETVGSSRHSSWCPKFEE